MVGKEPSSPLSTADEPHDRPESFCALFHWCESQRGWNRQVDQGRFGTSFVSHLKRLKQTKIASEFKARIRNDAYTDAIINDAQRLSVTLAIQTGELSEGWNETRAGDNSVEIPPSPLRRPGDFVAWFGSRLENLPKPGTEKYNAAPTAVKLWDDYQRAKGWAKQHGFGKLVPRIDPENDVRTTEWLRDRKGIAPCTRDAHVALNLLVEAIGKDLANDPPTSSSSKRFDKPAQTTSVEMIENLNRLEGSLDELMPSIRRLTEVAHKFDLEADGTTWNDHIDAEDLNWVQLIDDVAFVKKDRDTVDSMLLRVKSDLEKVRDQLPILKTDIVTFPCPARTHAEAAFEYALKHWELACRRFKEECPIAKLDSLDARVMRSIRRSASFEDDEFYAEESRYKDAVSRWRLHQLRDWVIGCRKLLTDVRDPYTFFLEIQARYKRELTEARNYFAEIKRQPDLVPVGIDVERSKRSPTTTDAKIEVEDQSGSPVEIPSMSEKEYQVLEEMKRLNATSADTRQNCETIAKACDGPQADFDSFKGILAEFTRRRLTESKKGRGGGSWLLSDGIKIAEKLLENRKVTSKQQ